MAKPKDRANGDCTVFERKDRPGTWRGQAVWLNPATGEQIVKSFDCSIGTDRQRKRVALEKAQDWLKKVQGGLLPDADKVTLWDWLERWLQDYVKPKVRVGSYLKCEGCLRLYIKPYLGKVLITRLKSPDIQRVLNQLLIDGGQEKTKKVDDKEIKEKKGIATGTVRVTRRYLIMALDQAVKVGLLTRNVIKETEPPKLTKKEIHPLNKKQAAKLAEVAKAAMEAATEEKTVRDSAYMAILLALATGARLGEILGLKWDCVNLDKGIIYIRRVLDLKQKGGIFNEPKTAKSQRQIPLPADVAKELKKYKTRQEWQKHLLGDKWEGCGDEKNEQADKDKDSGLVITNHFGRPLNASNFEGRYFKPYLAQAGISKTVKFHDLRHTHATLLLLDGVNVKVVSERLGHSTVQMTLDIYSHVLPGMQDTAVKALAGLFTKTGTKNN